MKNAKNVEAIKRKIKEKIKENSSYGPGGGVHYVFLGSSLRVREGGPGTQKKEDQGRNQILKPCNQCLSSGKGVFWDKIKIVGSWIRGNLVYQLGSGRWGG